MVVDLPAPLRPSRPSRRPSPRRRDTRCSTWLSPYSASISWSARASLAKVDLPGARVGDDLGARALDDHLAEVEHGDALREVQRDVHVVLDHDDGHFAGDGADE